MTEYLDVDGQQALHDAHGRWITAKLAADTAADTLAACADAYKRLLTDLAPDGAVLLAAGQKVATWTRRTRTDIDIAALSADHIAEFLACAKPPAVDAAKLRKTYPHLAAKYATVTPGSYELRLT